MTEHDSPIALFDELFWFTVLNVENISDLSKRPTLLTQECNGQDVVVYAGEMQHPDTMATNKIAWFSIDKVLHYASFCHDFGPLNICMLHRFCKPKYYGRVDFT
jgi:hypothetical protein